ncbi:thiamine pyrophosphate-dependent enzyme [Micromonospora sp. MA102]|uniref:thiamine pyrophosphate-dependent enzyme n=1 Tax=Micromonospora sp. MA102 TaxID=2952755 RepID=UPI0021CA0738|nr:thiamine pyrophosphate-dependent enzyme [Micromonospora sp. MA102]
MTEESTRSAGHLIADQMVVAGVRRVFCVPGESYLEVLDGLFGSPIEIITCRQEGGAGFMAIAHARLTGEAGIVMVTRGPGATNVSVAVHTAWQDATPLVLLVGLIPSEHRGREAFQELDLVAFLGSTAKAVFVLDDPDDAAMTLDRALALAAEGRPGPVVIGLPEDVLERASHGAVVAPTAVGPVAPDPAQVADVHTALAGARRPLLVVGGDGWDAATAARLAELSGRLTLPVAADFRSYDHIDNDSPTYVGPLGFGRTKRLADMMDTTDLLILLGGVRSDVMSDSYRLATDVPTVMIGPDPECIGHSGRVDRHVVADPAAFVAALTELAAEPAATDPQRADWLAEGRAAYLRDATPAAEGGELDLGAVFEWLRDRLPRDTIVTYGAGCHAAWPTRFLPAHGVRSVLGPKNGTMGYGVPAAVAASLEHPDRQVVSVAGDGCFLMNGQELATAVAHRARPLILVLDNSLYGTIALHQKVHHPGRPVATALVNPDFGALARAYGAYGEKVERTADFPAALDRALSAGTAAVLHLVMDPGRLLPP